MRLPLTGREYATWTITGAPVGASLEVMFDTLGSWSPLELVTGDDYRVLVAGPNSGTNPGGTVALLAGINRATIRCVDDPEIVVRNAGSIDVS